MAWCGNCVRLAIATVKLIEVGKELETQWELQWEPSARIIGSFWATASAVNRVDIQEFATSVKLTGAPPN